MKTLLLSAIKNALNAYLDLDPDSKQRLHALQGKAMTVELRPFHLLFQCVFTESGVTIYDEELLVADTTIRGTPLQMLGVMMNKHNRQQFFADDLVIEGNAEIGQQMIALFDELQIDWEEHASRLVGDVPAHHIGRFIRRTTNWIKQTRSSFSQDINEYVHEEAQWFPSKEALNDFFHAIDTLQVDVDRAEAKIKQLHSQLMEHEVSK